ncbi:MAG: hypothetical protein JWM56_663 [Candidatus Peribacteria bacterium]|nr:hypothetical protein [Candidatus Peribacteria bacterium]
MKIDYQPTEEYWWVSDLFGAFFYETYPHQFWDLADTEEEKKLLKFFPEIEIEENTYKFRKQTDDEKKKAFIAQKKLIPKIIEKVAGSATERLEGYVTDLNRILELHFEDGDDTMNFMLSIGWKFRIESWDEAKAMMTNMRDIFQKELNRRKIEGEPKYDE